MDKAQLDHFRVKLLASKGELQRELDAVPEIGDPEGESRGDLGDQSSAETDRDLIALNRERTRIMLREVEQALARIENGTYGICEDTGRPIGLKRLEAQPTATLSVEAQAERERGRA